RDRPSAGVVVMLSDQMHLDRCGDYRSFLMSFETWMTIGHLYRSLTPTFPKRGTWAQPRPSSCSSMSSIFSVSLSPSSIINTGGSKDMAAQFETPGGLPRITDSRENCVACAPEREEASASCWLTTFG